MKLIGLFCALLPAFGYAEVGSLTSVRSLKVKGSLVHHLSKRNGAVSAYVPADQDCRAIGSPVSLAAASRLFEGFHQTIWRNGRTQLPLRSGVELCVIGTPEETRTEVRHCIEGHWDNWFDGEPHRDYICDRYSETVDHYKVSVSWTGGLCREPGTFTYEILCQTKTHDARATITLEQFERAFSNAFEVQ